MTKTKDTTILLIHKDYRLKRLILSTPLPMNVPLKERETSDLKTVGQKVAHILIS